MAFDTNKALYLYGEVEEIEIVNPAGADLTAHKPTPFSDSVVIPKNDIVSGAKGWFWDRGVFKVSKNASLVISAGDKVYWDVAEGAVNKTAEDNTLMGTALLDAGSTDAYCVVKLNTTYA